MCGTWFWEYPNSEEHILPPATRVAFGLWGLEPCIEKVWSWDSAMSFGVESNLAWSWMVLLFFWYFSCCFSGAFMYIRAGKLFLHGTQGLGLLLKRITVVQCINLYHLPPWASNESARFLFMVRRLLGSGVTLRNKSQKTLLGSTKRCSTHPVAHWCPFNFQSVPAIPKFALVNVYGSQKECNNDAIGWCWDPYSYISQLAFKNTIGPLRGLKSWTHKLSDMFFVNWYELSLVYS